MNKYRIGSCRHEVSAEAEGYVSDAYVAEAPVVLLYNDDDSFYVTEYNSWDEINEFISELKAAATKAFGVHPDLEAGK